MTTTIQTDLPQILQNFLVNFYNRPHNQPFWFPKKEPLNTWLSNNLRPGKPAYKIENIFLLEVPLMVKDDTDFYHIPKIAAVAFRQAVEKEYKNWLRGQFSEGIAKGITRDLSIFEIMNWLNLIPENIINEINQVNIADPDAVKFIKDLITSDEETNRFYERVQRDHSRYIQRKIINRRYHQKKSRKLNR